MNSRTVRNFTVSLDVWPIVERWAKTEGFVLVEDLGETRRYQKGNGWIVLPTKLEVTLKDSSVHMEVWVYGSIFNRIFTLFMLPEEITIESGGVRALIPRTVSRESVNRLLTLLGQPMIE